MRFKWLALTGKVTTASLFEFTPTGQPTIKSLWNVADSPDTQYVGDISTPLED